MRMTYQVEDELDEEELSYDSFYERREALVEEEELYTAEIASYVTRPDVVSRYDEEAAEAHVLTYVLVGWTFLVSVVFVGSVVSLFM